MNVNRLAGILVIVVGIVFILFELKDMLMPFVLALLIWFLIKEVNRFFGKLKIKGKPLPTWLRSLFSFVLMFGVLSLIVSMLSANIAEIKDALPDYQERVLEWEDAANARWNINIGAELKNRGGELNFQGLITNVLDTLTNLFGNTFMILIYVVFLLMEESLFRPKLKAIFSGNEEYESTSRILARVNKSMSNYLSLKSLVSFITGLASYLILWIIGIDFAFFWAFLIFLLNYIPTVGSLIGTVFPALIALLQFDSMRPAVLVLVLVGIVQVLVGNLLEPKLMGNSLNVSPLVVLLSLTLWGSLWGVVGMILSVPITVMMVIVFAQFESTKSVAILLSEKGNV